MAIFQRLGADELFAPQGMKHRSQDEESELTLLRPPSAGCGVRVRTEQLPAPSLHSHFPNLFAVVAQDLEEPIQDLRQIIQQVDVWHGLQNQNLTQGKRPGGKVTPAWEPSSPPHQYPGTGQGEGGPADVAFHGATGAPGRWGFC